MSLMLIPLLLSCVTLSKLWYVYEPQFPHLYNGDPPRPFWTVAGRILTLGKGLDMVNT